MKKLKNKYFFLAFILVLSLIPLADFMKDGFPITHDGQDHIARVANFYSNLSEGVIVPRWAGKLNWGYGHPILMFLYPLPSYFASLFIFLGFGIINSVKIVFILGYLASGLSMFVWLREEFDGTTGFIGAFLYNFAPYRFVDLYVRGAIGEHIAFVFPPLVFYFLLKLSKKSSFWYLLGGSASLAGLILSHNAISLMFLPIFFLYSVYLIHLNKNKKKLIYLHTCILVFGFGVSAFFWIPAFMEGKYTLRNIVTNKDYSERFVNIKDFFSTYWSYGGTNMLSKQIGIVQWLFIITAILIVIKEGIRNKKNLLLKASLIILLSSLVIMTSFSKPVWDLISILQKFQFPWRFLTLSVFLASVIGAIVVDKAPKRFSHIIAVITVSLLFIVNMNYWRANGFLRNPESFYNSIYNSTTDTGESSPIWSVRFMEKRANGNTEVIEGSAEIDEIFRNNTHHLYKIDSKEKARIRENTLYFPGWTVSVNGRKVQPEFQDPMNRGLMTFYVDKGTSNVEINFKETKLRKIANIISASSLILLMFSGIIFYYKYGKAFRGSSHL